MTSHVAPEYQPLLFDPNSGLELTFPAEGLFGYERPMPNRRKSLVLVNGTMMSPARMTPEEYFGIPKSNKFLTIPQKKSDKDLPTTPHSNAGSYMTALNQSSGMSPMNVPYNYLPVSPSSPCMNYPMPMSPLHSVSASPPAPNSQFLVIP